MIKVQFNVDFCFIQWLLSPNLLSGENAVNIVILQIVSFNWILLDFFLLLIFIFAVM